MMVCASAMSPPPPMPCRPRARMRAIILGASAQAMEPMMKITMPISMVMRRP